MKKASIMRWINAFALLILLGCWGGLASTARAQEQSNLPGPSNQAPRLPTGTAAPASNLPLPVAGPQDENYKLGSGDKLRIVVYGEDDLGGEYLVDGAGD